MDGHLKAAGILNIIHGAIGLVGAFFALLMLAGIGFVSAEVHREEEAMLLAGVGVIIALVISIISLPSLIVGIGLLKRSSWARLTGIIVSCLNLIHFPMGTGIGGYTLWVLFNDEVAAMFEPGRKIYQQSQPQSAQA
jgi:hypothetical protein